MRTPSVSLLKLFNRSCPIWVQQSELDSNGGCLDEVGRLQRLAREPRATHLWMVTLTKRPLMQSSAWLTKRWSEMKDCKRLPGESSDWLRVPAQRFMLISEGRTARINIYSNQK